jgi:hypothetical protein
MSNIRVVDFNISNLSSNLSRQNQIISKFKEVKKNLKEFDNVYSAISGKVNSKDIYDDLVKNVKKYTNAKKDVRVSFNLNNYTYKIDKLNGMRGGGGPEDGGEEKSDGEEGSSEDGETSQGKVNGQQDNAKPNGVSLTSNKQTDEVGEIQNQQIDNSNTESVGEGTNNLVPVYRNSSGNVNSVVTSGPDDSSSVSSAEGQYVPPVNQTQVTSGPDDSSSVSSAEGQYVPPVNQTQVTSSFNQGQYVSQAVEVQSNSPGIDGNDVPSVKVQPNSQDIDGNDVPLTVEGQTQGVPPVNQTQNGYVNNNTSTNTSYSSSPFALASRFFSGGNNDEYSDTSSDDFNSDYDSDDSETSYTKNKTYLFDSDDDDEESLIENAKYLKSKKYLNSLTVNELKQHMKKNNIKLSVNGSYYRKNEMIKLIQKKLANR